MMQERKEKESSNNVVMDTRPYFFKIIADGLNSERLRIPPHFMKHISEDLSGSAVLRGPSGGSWNVKILKNGKATFMLEGWQVFVKDHSLGHSEFLLFKYDGNLRFSVQIFNKSGLERASRFTPCTPQCRDGKEKPGRSRKHPVASLGPHQPVSHTYGSGNSLKKYRETGSDQVNISEERIPYGFMKHMLNEELGTATLESSSGRRWSVELRRKKDGLFITDGWQEFIRDNSLIKYELVLLTYDGKKHFSVQIFDPSGLEKASAPLITSMYQEAASSSTIKRKRGRPRKSTVSPFNLRRPKPGDGASDEHHQSREQKKYKRSAKKKSTRTKIKLGELDAASHKANSRLKELGKRNTKSDARTVKEGLPVHEEVMESVQGRPRVNIRNLEQGHADGQENQHLLHNSKLVYSFEPVKNHGRSAPVQDQASVKNLKSSGGLVSRVSDGKDGHGHVEKLVPPKVGQDDCKHDARRDHTFVLSSEIKQQLSSGNPFAPINFMPELFHCGHDDFSCLEDAKYSSDMLKLSSQDDMMKEFMKDDLFDIESFSFLLIWVVFDKL
ncbi:hypothetical protein RJ639_018352 [Escallonia herrerae]|uniref:TF-B3 domain-containing protein n=1 Tax=Escallonia herrerae TaxID=1293975 RepID=A0AA88V6L7_9ASTE|nr:hypothetical protein RJ639_018352 [Escallonia herrerae]